MQSGFLNSKILFLACVEADGQSAGTEWGNGKQTF